MYTFLFIFLLFFNPVSPSSPDRYFKSLPSTLHRRHTFQEYLELTHPEPSDLLIPSCTLPVLHHSFGNTVNSPPFTVPYSPPSDCPSPWSRVVLDFHASCRGDQYDRIAALWLGGAEVLRTSTAEPTQTGIFWKVRKDITRYSSLLARSNLELTMMLENVVNEVFTGVYHINVTFFYYDDNTVRVPFSPLDDHKLDTKLGSEPTGGANMLQGLWNSYGKPADVIIPISDDRDKGFWFRIEGKSDVHSKIIRIPCNTRRAILELYVSFHGDDEFWYSNPPDSYIKSNHLPTSRGGGAYREVYVTIDEEFVASVVPFPVIFTGGINPLFWEPVVAIGAFNLPSYEFDLSPFLGNLVDGKNHNFSIGVADSIPFWLVDANLHIWLDHRKSKVKAKSIVIYPTPALSGETPFEVQRPRRVVQDRGK
ncbi:hypothetical protein L1049_011222 [Liquidambar formosana]|uniref:Peptide N-acetyl-beta-D-glucosaminyl asparaginase amidase A N-terminal domain-containing protein n=1 Tax=Liquidambar formosana TaxID=63359 RepID=A0AAP0RX78_LIQFO